MHIVFNKISHGRHNLYYIVFFFVCFVFLTIYLVLTIGCCNSTVCQNEHTTSWESTIELSSTLDSNGDYLIRLADPYNHPIPCDEDLPVTVIWPSGLSTNTVSYIYWLDGKLWAKRELAVQELEKCLEVKLRITRFNRNEQQIGVFNYVLRCPYPKIDSKKNIRTPPILEWPEWGASGSASGRGAGVTH